MATFDFNSYKNYVNGNNNMYTSTINVGNNPFGCNSRGIDILSSVFNIAALVTCYAVQPGYSGGGGGGSTAKASAQTQIQIAETKVEALEKQIAQCSKNVMTKETYESQKKELTESLENLKSDYNVSGKNSCDTELKDYESACAAYDTAVSNQKEYNEYQTQLTQIKSKAPIAVTGDAINPELADGGLNALRSKYDKMFGYPDPNDSSKTNLSLADKKFNNDLAKAEKINADYQELKAKMNLLGDVNKAVADALKDKNAKEKALNKAMGGDENGTEKSTAYMNAKKGIEQKLADLEIKYKGSAEAQTEITALKTQLSAAKTELIQAQTVLEKIEQADDDVASAKAAKKAAKKKGLSDGNFLTRIFNKGHRKNHKLNKDRDKIFNQQIEDAKQRRDTFET